MKILIGLINGMIAAATPILLAALGGTLTFYAGIFNIAMEGMMLVGAFFAVIGSYYFSSWVMGILLAILSSVVMACIFILFSVILKTDEFVTGIGLNLFALGTTTYLLRQIFDVKGAFAGPGIVPVPRLDLPLIEDIPVVGQILSGHNLIVYLTLLITFAVSYLVLRPALDCACVPRVTTAPAWIPVVCRLPACGLPPFCFVVFCVDWRGHIYRWVM